MTQPGLALRAAGPADARDLAAIHAAAFEDAWSADALEALLRGPGALGLMAIRPPGAGFILCRAAADEAEILTLATAPDHRRCGHGGALLRAARDALAARGARSIFLEVARDNHAARSLYAAAGFCEAGERRAYYARPPGAVDALVLRLDLNR